MHLKALQASSLSETNVYFYFWRPSWIWQQDDLKHKFNTKNGFVTMKLVGLKVLL